MTRKSGFQQFIKTFFSPRVSNIQRQPKPQFTCGRCGKHHIDIDTHSSECKGV